MFRCLATFDPDTPQYLRQRDAIVERCLPLADHIARRFRNRGEPLDDLIQVARVGLMNAVNRFDVDNGAEFVAFAVPTVMGEVRRHFRDHGWSVKVPRRLKELNAQLKRCREELSHELGRAPTASEIAAKLGIDREEVVQAQIASSAYSTLSSDAPAGAGDDDDGRSVTNTIGDVDANLEKVLDVATVRPLLAALPDRERRRGGARSSSITTVCYWTYWMVKRRKASSQGNLQNSEERTKRRTRIKQITSKRRRIQRRQPKRW